MLFRFMMFLFSYGICVISVTNLLLYLNYRTLGYSWSAVLFFIVRSHEFYLMIISLVIIFLLIFGLFPSRFPFF